MKIYWFFQFLTLPIIFLSCATSDSNDPLLAEAHTHHQAAMSIHDTVLSKLDVLTQGLEKVEVKDSSYTAQLNVLNSIQQEFNRWDESLVSVPGFEAPHDHNHDHDHDHDHDHSHAETDLSDMAPEKILELQKELEMEIGRIQKRADSLLAEIN